MKPEAQWYLVEILSSARSRMETSPDYEAKQKQLSHFAGVLAGFRYLEAITQEEEHEWFARMLAALGYQPPEAAPPGASRAMYVGDPTRRSAVPTPRPPPTFIRSQPGPERDFETHGGTFRVVSLEFYDSEVTFRWRVSQEPDVASLFPEEIAALEQDLVGLEEWAATDLRRKGQSKLRIQMYGFGQFGLLDDLGTRYMQLGSRYGSGQNGLTGELEFPAPPPDASVLTLTWLDIEVRIPIA